jgi:hypothetical protein
MRPDNAFMLLAAALAIGACSPKPKTFDKLKIEAVESGPVPASTAPNVPDQEGVVAYTRENAGIVKAVYRKTVPCPTRMIQSLSGIEVKPDRILLCFEPVESSDPASRPLSACPYDLVLKYEMRGIPASVEPKFEAKDGCTRK